MEGCGTNCADSWQSISHPNFLWMERLFVGTVKIRRSPHIRILWIDVSQHVKPHFIRKKCHVKNAGVSRDRSLKYFLHVRIMDFLDDINMLWANFSFPYRFLTWEIRHVSFLPTYWLCRRSQEPLLNVLNRVTGHCSLTSSVLRP
jgi:hypothetical protein